MDQILEGYFADFIGKNELRDLPEAAAFENFATHCVLRSALPPPYDFDISDLSCGDAAGVDAIAIFVNDRFTTAIEALDSSSSQRMGVHFFFVQAKRSSSFDQGDMLKFFSAVERFFIDTTGANPSDSLHKWITLKNDIYKRSAQFADNPKVTLYYVTSGTWNDVPLHVTEIASAKAKLESLRLFGSVAIVPIGAEQLRKSYRALTARISRQVNFEKHTIVPRIEGIRQALIGTLPVSEYLKLISADTGEIMRGVFYDNVRDFQGENAVNREITETLINDPTGNQRFVLLNNGVTIVAKAIRQIGTDFIIEDYQIVNGCQTSYVLYKNKNNLKGTEHVTLKLIETEDSDVANQITKATNRQTSVNLEAFAGLQQFHKELEAFYASFPKETRLYYERRSCQYDADNSVITSKIVTVPTQIKAFLSCFLEEPHQVHYYYGQLLRNYSEGKSRQLFSDRHSPFPYYLSSWLVLMVTREVRNHRAINPIWRYHIALIVRILVGGIFQKSSLVNAKQAENYCRKVVDHLRSAESQREIVVDAWSILCGEHGTSPPPNNATRSSVFTDSLIQRAAVQAPAVTKQYVGASQISIEAQYAGEITAVVADRHFGYVKYGHRHFLFHFSYKNPFTSADVGRKVRFRLTTMGDAIDATDVTRIEA